MPSDDKRHHFKEDSYLHLVTEEHADTSELADAFFEKKYK